MQSTVYLPLNSKIPIITKLYPWISRSKSRLLPKRIYALLNHHYLVNLVMLKWFEIPLSYFAETIVSSAAEFYHFAFLKALCQIWRIGRGWHMSGEAYQDIGLFASIEQSFVRWRLCCKPHTRKEFLNQKKTFGECV